VHRSTNLPPWHRYKNGSETINSTNCIFEIANYPRIQTFNLMWGGPNLNTTVWGITKKQGGGRSFFLIGQGCQGASSHALNKNLLTVVVAGEWVDQKKMLKVDTWS
jgi:hypothetical protein